MNGRLLNPFLVLLSLIFLASCGFPGGGDGGHEGEGYRAALQTMLEQQWMAYGQNKSGWGGGIALRVLSPKGDYFVFTGLDRPITLDTHFRGASTTKTFTAAGILWLHQEGMLNIEDFITDLIPGTNQPYIPDTPDYDIPYKNQITIRQLLGHRAGVFDVSNDVIPETVQAPYAGKYYIEYVKMDLNQPEHTFTFDELTGVAAEHQLSYYPPGTDYHYSNTGYGLLGKIIERVSGQSYAAFIQEKFLKPNDFVNTGFPSSGDDIGLPTPFKTGYLWSQGVLTDVTDDNMSPHVAEGNVISTPRELSLWVKRLITGKAGLDKATVEMMTDVEPTGSGFSSYGLGISYNPGLGYGHNGGHIGYVTVMRHDPDYDVTLLITAFVFDDDNFFDELIRLHEIAYAARDVLGYPGSNEL